MRTACLRVFCALVIGTALYGAVPGDVVANGNDDVTCQASAGHPDTIHLKGRFFFNPISDDDLVERTPGAYWTIAVRWTDRGVVMGSCSVETEPDGGWELVFSRPGNADALEVSVLSRNAYVEVTTEPGDAYEVTKLTGLPLPASESEYDVGDLVADLSGTGPSRGTSLHGVGDVMWAAVDFWLRTWAYGLDVVSRDRDDKPKVVRIYYPNTWHDCGTGTGVPGTCASFDERSEIWITGPDITDRAHGRLGRHLTVMHEVAHELNASRWQYTQPTDPDKPAEPCMDAANAMMEGFATAIAAWALYGEYATKPVVVWLSTDRDPIETDLESPGSQYRCDRGEQDDTWVSAMFWDLIDTQDDGPHTPGGSDQWSYGDPMTPFRIYLDAREKDGAPMPPNDVFELKAKLMDRLKPADRRYIDEIYRLNQMFGP